jgi:hypothetical protein
MFAQCPSFQITRTLVRLWPSLALLAILSASIVVAVEAAAHHPGSHARRLNPAAVWIDVAYLATDGCTKIGQVKTGLPPGISRPRDGVAVIVQLRRENAGQPCIQAVSAQRAGREIFIPRGEILIHLYVLDVNGAVVNSERVRID